MTLQGGSHGLFGMGKEVPSRQLTQQPSASKHTLDRLLDDLCVAGILERRANDAERPLVEYIDAEARAWPADVHAKMVRDLYVRLDRRAQEKSPDKKLCVILAVNDLIDVKSMGDDAAARSKKLVGLLTRVLKDAEDVSLIEVGTQVMGRLVKAYAGVSSEEVEKQVREALDVLNPYKPGLPGQVLEKKMPEPSESQRLTALYMLASLAQNAEAVFNVHVKHFIETIWYPLREPKLHIREAAVMSLKACLKLVAERETRYRVQWYYKLFEQTMRGCTRDTRNSMVLTNETVHGSLIALKQLLQHTGEFLLARYKEVVETVLKYRDSKDKQIRKAVITLLPHLAAFSPERFATEYLGRALTHLITTLKNPAERAYAFTAIAEMSSALAGSNVQFAHVFEPCLPAISAHIRESIGLLKPKSRVPCPEALACVGVLAAALRDTWRPYAASLLEPMILSGLSQGLVDSLTMMANSLPELLAEIQVHLMDSLSLVLSRKPFSTVCNKDKALALVAANMQGELKEAGLIKLALQTLSNFNFDMLAAPLLDFTRDHVLAYTEDSDKETRQAAVLACAKVLERFATSVLPRCGLQASHGGDMSVSQLMSHSSAAAGLAAPMSLQRATKLVEKVTMRLLVVAVADPSQTVRMTVLTVLTQTEALDDYLAQADMLRCLFMTLNDQACPIRELGIRLVGRLATRNPAYINPAMRRHLLQLLTDMEHSPDSRMREDAAFLLEALIASVPRLILPYVSPINKALVAKLRALGGAPGSNGIMAGVGAAASMGPLAVGGISSSNGYVPHPHHHHHTHSKDDRGKGGALPSKAGIQRGEAPGASEAGVARTVLSTLGRLGQVSRAAYRPYVSEVLPLVIDAIQDTANPSKRAAAVIAVGQIVESTGSVMTPYMDFPQLLSVLLRMLHEGSNEDRMPIMRVLGIIGALDPHTHKTNQASLSGEGKLEKEGVRPLRQGVVPAAAGGGGLVPAAPGGDHHQGGEGGIGGGDGDVLGVPNNELLPSNGLVTSSDDFYPTVALNALVRALRDPALASQQSAVVSSLCCILKGLGVNAVQFLPKVLPVLFSLSMIEGDVFLRNLLLGELTILVQHVRQRMRRFLPELLGLVHTHWVAATPECLRLLRELSVYLRDDVRSYVPELLPKFVTLIAEAERNNDFSNVGAALSALEALGAAAEEHLHLLLPALTRLISNAQVRVEGREDPRKQAIRSLRKLLPRMQVTGYASAVLHPLIKAVDGPQEDLRRDALDAICTAAVLMGPDFQIFVPIVRKAVHRHKLQHEWFERLAGICQTSQPPCMSEAEDWEASSAWAGEIDALMADSATQPLRPPPEPAAQQQLAVDESQLSKAWESSQRVTKEDWHEWMRHFSVELLRQSPSPALRECFKLAQVHPGTARELFAAGFVSCWSSLNTAQQEQLVRSLEAALASPTIPPEIVTSLLNLAEFMEHDDKRLPLDTRTLGALAEKCHAFAKALHYKEMEFQASPLTAIEALIHINNQLRQPEAAVGVLAYTQKHLHLELKESWYEKLCRWDEALEAYERRLRRAAPAEGRQDPHKQLKRSAEYCTALLGKMRCLASLAEWERLSALCAVEWEKSEPHMRREMAMIAAHAAWHMGAWEDMRKYVNEVEGGTADVAVKTSATAHFLRAVLEAHDGKLKEARMLCNKSRESMSTEFAALVGESYERAYTDMVRVQQLTELEEVIEYKQAVMAATKQGVLRNYDISTSNSNSSPSERIRLTQQLWRDRLKGVQRHVEVWQSLLSVRQLVLPMDQDIDSWLKFASLCRKSGRVKQAHRTLIQLLGGVDPLGTPLTHMYQLDSQPSSSSDNITVRGSSVGGAAVGVRPPWRPHVLLAYLKHCYLHIDRQQSLARLKELVAELGAAQSAATTPSASRPAQQQPQVQVPPELLESGEGGGAASGSGTGGVNGATTCTVQVPPVAVVTGAATAAGEALSDRPRPSLVGRAYLRLGNWLWAMNDAQRLDTPGIIPEVLSYLRNATQAAPAWSKAWHQWALFNVAVMLHHSTRGDQEAAMSCVAPAVAGFFRSVALGQAAGDRTGNLQDILRLLTLWFNYGQHPDVERTLQEGFNLVSIDTWLVVIPQIIARIHTNNATVRSLIHSLLVKVGRHHPQALMYPLLVATKSQSPGRRAAAYAVLDCIRQHSPSLVDQAQLVSHELIRMAILWAEMWHEGLEEASRLYFGESNVEAMLATLLPLHDMMERTGPTTLKEIAFVQTYGRELAEAYDWLQNFRTSRKEPDLHQAWDLYYHVFKRINKQLHTMHQLELQYVAPALVRAQGMELAVPGTYIAGEPLVTIAAFAPTLHVISSKQRPRKLTIHGGDGAEYMFLLKGHEDLRQDERVMQLFGLVNTMLANDRATAERDLSIARYAVIPLSPNSGLIGWVPNCDTLHALIREYRDARKIPLNWEHRLMLGMAPDYDHLTVIQKVEVFEYALEATSGEDLHKVLWLKSRNSEVWLDRRTNYTRSTAVMSMVGYILGLGDRHPSNLMLDRYSGKLLHIDFGDCFEASMHREKFPEKVPFRLTRMMVKAMEVAGLEGNFRTTCENVMRVLRTNKESVTAMLEAFVHDPLINWRLLNTTDTTTGADVGGAAIATDVPGGGSALLNAVVGGGAAGSGLAAGGVGVGDADDMQMPRRDARERELREAAQQIGDANEVLNTRAVAVMQRMSDKLMGRDGVFEGVAAGMESDSVTAQVQRLIEQATSHENLCQSYIGWCPFW